MDMVVNEVFVLVVVCVVCFFGGDFDYGIFFFIVGLFGLV